MNTKQCRKSRTIGSVDPFPISEGQRKGPATIDSERAKTTHTGGKTWRPSFSMGELRRTLEHDLIVMMFEWKILGRKTHRKGEATTDFENGIMRGPQPEEGLGHEPREWF